MPTYTLAQLETSVWSGLDGNQGEFAEDNVRRALNQGLARLNLILGIQSATLPVPGNTVVGQLLYTCPAGIMIPVRFDYEGEEIDRLSLDRLARAYPTWAIDTSATMGPPARVGMIDLSQFILHPADTYGGGLLEVTGIVPSTQLVSQGDVVQLENQWAECLIAYAKPRLLFKEGGKAFADAVEGYKPYQNKIRAASIWKSIDWGQMDEARQQRPAVQRWGL